MSKFKLNPLSIALLGAIATPTFAETTTENQNHQLSTIVVSAAGFEQDIKNAPASISVITSEDLQKKGITSIADALTDIPGVDVRNGQGKTGGLNIQMRGLGQDYTLILIDGQRQNTSGSIGPNGFGEFSTSFMPPLASIERIEVIRGPMSTLYGSDAMGGIINIITKKVSNEWLGNISAEQTIQENSDIGNQWKTSAVVNGPLIQDKLGIQLRGEFFHRENSERLVAPKTTDKLLSSQGRDPRTVEANNYALGTKLTYNINDNISTWIDLDRAEQRFDNSDARLGEHFDYNRTTGLATGIGSYKDEIKFIRDRISLGADADLKIGQWKTFVSQVKSKQEGRRLPKGDVPEYNYYSDGTNDRKLENTDLTIDSRITSSIIKDHKLTSGVEYKDGETIDASAGNGQAFAQDSWSIFIEDEWRLTESLGFTFGGRYENHSAFGSHFTPRAYLVWNTNDQWTLKGGVSTGYRVPTANDLHDGINGFSGQGKNVSLGNSDLKPEETTNYELGFVFDNLSNFSITTTAFYTQFKDLIIDGATSYDNCLYTDPKDPSYKPSNNCMTIGNFSNQKEFTYKGNADEAKSYGVELSAIYDIASNLQLKGNYTWLESEITKGDKKGQSIENTPRHAINLTGVWLVNDKLSTWLEAEYKSKRVRFTDLSTQDARLEAAVTGNELKSYELFNLGASYKVNNQVTLSGRVNNLLNKDFGDYRTFINSENESVNAFLYTKTSSGLAGTYIPDRNYWLSISYDF